MKVNIRSEKQLMKALEWISAHESVGVMMEEPGMEAGEWKEESMMEDKPRNGQCYFFKKIFTPVVILERTIV